MLFVCSNCKNVVGPVRDGDLSLPSIEGAAINKDIDCRKCGTIYRVQVSVLHAGRPYKWNPKTGELAEVKVQAHVPTPE